MPLNPNIILSGMPQPFDTNALLQQQISGMENINTLERQRRADELAMQDRAAAAEKEAAQAQEAATLKALLPAYTYGIQTGDMAGALNLVPPEMQESLRPYADALVGKSPQEVQAALIGSLSSSPAGQEALGAIQRAQTAQIQLGQLDVSRGRLAFDTEQAAAEAARGPEPSYKEVVLDDGTLMLMDTKSGKIIKPTMEGPIDTAVPPQEGAPAPLKVKTEATKDRAAKEKTELGKTKVEATLDKMLQSYQKLKDLDAIVSTEREGIAGTLSNIGARAGAALGTTVGRATGTKAQTERDVIQNLRMDLVRDIKQATGMSAQELNSNFELQAILDSLSDPYGQSYETAIRTIQRLSEAYGKGSKADISTGPAAAPGAESEDPELNDLLEKYLPK